MRSRLNPQLNWLPTHTACNSSFRSDEEYAITALFPMALTHDHRAIPTPAAASVLDDIVEGGLRGHGNKLTRSMIKHWGTVVGPRNEVRVTLDFARIDRVMSKIARGLYCIEMGAILPLSVPLRMDLYTSMMAEQAQARPEIRAVINTASMGRYPDVFDYRWGCFLNAEGFRGNLIVMLWWGSLLVTVGFMDPTCKLGIVPTTESS